MVEVYEDIKLLRSFIFVMYTYIYLFFYNEVVGVLIICMFIWGIGR